MAKTIKSTHVGKAEGLSLFGVLLYESVTGWIDHKGAKMGAALAYYTAFSLAPLIIFLLSLVSLVMKRDEAARRIVAQMSDLVGAEGGKVVEEILQHAGTMTAISWSTVFSFGILLVSASGAFGELQDSLNTIWGVPAQKHPWLIMIKERVLSLSMVFVLGFFMMSSLLISAFVTGLTGSWEGSVSKACLEVVNTIASLLIFTSLFACIFKLLPEISLGWRDVVPGALMSSVLFIIGKFLLGWYISHSAFASSYGAAGSFVVILFWVFYSAQILFFGAEFTRACSLHTGSSRDMS